MKFTKASVYAALAMVYLGKQPSDQLIQARQVAEHLSIPVDSMLKVLQALSRHGLIQSRLGRSGGYRLSRGAASITFLQIVEAIDGPVTVDGLAGAKIRKATAGMGLLKSVWEQTVQQVRDGLNKKTVADLAQHADQGILLPLG